MNAAFGLWTMGAKSGHYHLVLISYLFKVNTGIPCCSDIDFGHPWLYIVD